MKSATGYNLLPRLAIYIVLLAWIILGLYIADITEHIGLSTSIIRYFLSTEESGVKFRALILLAPFVLTVVSYLINERAKLFKQTIVLNKQLQQQVEMLEHFAFYDELTGLPNRASFIDGLRASIIQTTRQKDYMFAVLFLDLDRFKNINDSLGHMAGDLLLKEVAARIKKSLRAYDTATLLTGNNDEAVARFGGDEFGVLLSDIKSVRDVVRVAERLQNEIKSPIKIYDRDVYSTVSIGITVGKAGCERPEDILRDADTAMYKAKSLGRGGYVIFDEAMHAQATSYLQMENCLRRIVEKNECVLHYQPVLISDANKIVGFEALLRWESPERGLVFPHEFISVAEETGLIVPIGIWVVREACRQMRQWHQIFPECAHLTVSVNISTRQFTPDLIESLKQVLNETGLNPNNLKLDITESVIMNNIEIAADIFSQLKNLNVKVQIDDFGTGYSSLSYLGLFAFDALKIDKSFVKAMFDNKWAMEIIKTIISMAHNMNMEAIAEGVETVEQLEELRALKCDYFQGYWFSKPLDSKEVEALFEKQ